MSKIETAAALEKTSTNVRKYLDVSTSHVTDDDRKFLEDKALDKDNYVEIDGRVGFRVVGHEYGWFISVPKLSEHDMASDEFKSAVAEEGLLSGSFADLIIYAGSLGCLWINLDQDADTEEGLPTFEW